MLAAAGAIAGMLTGRAAIALIAALYPAIPFSYAALGAGRGQRAGARTALLFAWLPAGQAARLEPVLALGQALRRCYPLDWLAGSFTRSTAAACAAC